MTTARRRGPHASRGAAADALLHARLPFTRRELARAFRLVAPPPKAARLAGAVASLARSAHHARPGTASFDVGEELFALLAIASPAFAARVARLRDAEVAEHTARALRQAARGAPSDAERPPDVTAAVVRAAVDARWEETLARTSAALAAYVARRRVRRPAAR